MSNIFLVAGNVLVTPCVGAGVRGVMRRLVLERASAIGIECHERRVTDTDIAGADEMFITNSVIGICPVRRIETRTMMIGTMTRRLQAETDNELERRACSEN